MSARAALSPRSLGTSDHTRLVQTLKALAMDTVETARSGHPGMPMGTANFAASLWSQFLVHDPSDPGWIDRDRFVLSAGHGSALLYGLLHLYGYDLSLDDLKRFRRLGSRTPGHPELNETPGVEITSGPLGTGFAAGVGMAVAERFLAAKFNRPGHTLIDHFVYGIVSDGDLMEGVASEAASFAGHQRLGKLVYLYDSNAITIDGSTDLSFGERVDARFEAYGWHVQTVDGRDPVEVSRAIACARAESSAPSLIVCRTVIGEGAPTKAGSAASHGAPLGPDEVAAVKREMAWPVETPFFVPPGLVARLAASLEPVRAIRDRWTATEADYHRTHTELGAAWTAAWTDAIPDAVLEGVPPFAVGKALATRKAGAQVLTALMAAVPTLIGGSADLMESNGVDVPGMQPMTAGTPAGRRLHFGVREHAMAGICNGIAVHGGLRPFGATFLVFSDFMRGCIRLAALMKLPVVHVLSHDSIFLGEDGPTHQPIEHCMSLRMIPDLHVVRPADANETLGAWKLALGRKRGDGPTAILVTRQALPTQVGSRTDISVGGYVLWDPLGTEVANLHGILIATGSEVELARQAAEQLLAEGKAVRVVSLPCWEAFENQEPGYRDQVLPPSIRRRLSIEAGVTLGWERYAAAQHGIDRFGASGRMEELAEAFGFTPDAIVARYRELA